MTWQKIQKWLIKYTIVWIVCVSINLASAQDFTLGQEKLLGEGGIFSPDGNLLAVRTIAGVSLFDTGNLRLIQHLPAKGWDVSNLAFSSDSRYFAFSWIEEDGLFGPGAGGVGVWDLTTFTQVAYFPHVGVVYFVPGGEILAVMEYDAPYSPTEAGSNIVHFWKIGTWKKHGSWGGGQVSRLAFTHDGKQFVVSTAFGVPWSDLELKQLVVNIQTLETVAERDNPFEEMIAYAPDGRFEVVWVYERELNHLLVRNSQNHNLITKLYEGNGRKIRFHSISPESKWLATTNRENQVFLWNTTTWEIDHQLNPTDGQIIAEGFVKGSFWCADLTATGDLRLWDLIKGELLASERYDKTNGGIVAIDVTQDSKWIVAATDDKQVIVWDLETQDRVKTIQAVASDLQFSSDSLRLAIVDNKNIHVWDTTTWKPIARYGTWEQVAPYAISRIAFAPKEHNITIADIQGKWGDLNYKLIVWDPDEDKIIHETKLIAGFVSQLRFSKDGKFVAIAESGILRIWEVANFREIASFSHEQYYIAFHPNNRLVASCSNNTGWDSPELVLWDFQVDEVKKRKQLSYIRQLRVIAFSQDGSHLGVVGGYEGPHGQGDVRDVHLLDTDSLEVKASFEGHQGEVTDILFTPDGQYLITASLDGKVRGWQWRDVVADVQPMGLKQLRWGSLKNAELLPSYPNPANPETWIPFTLHETAEVEIRIYDIAGNLVRTLRLGNKSPGAYLSKKQAAYWDGKNDNGEEISSGIYFYQMRVGDETFMRKAMLLK